MLFGLHKNPKSSSILILNSPSKLELKEPLCSHISPSSTSPLLLLTGRFVIERQLPIKRVQKPNTSSGFFPSVKWMESQVVTQSSSNQFQRPSASFLGGVCIHAHSCPTLCDPIDCSLPGSSVYGISQARIVEWVAISSSRDLPDPGIEPLLLMSPAMTGRFFTTDAIWEAISAKEFTD